MKSDGRRLGQLFDRIRAMSVSDESAASIAEMLAKTLNVDNVRITVYSRKSNISHVTGEYYGNILIANSTHAWRRFDIAGLGLRPSGLIEIQTKNILGSESLLHSISEFFHLVLESQWVNRLLRRVLEPISLELSFHDYCQQLAKTACEASEARYALIRLKEGVADPQYKCVGYFDALGSISGDKEHFDVEKNHPLFNLFSEIVQTADKTAEPHIQQFTRSRNPREIDCISNLMAEPDIQQTLTVPLMLGGTTGGLLGLGFDSEVQFSEPEKNAIYTLASQTNAAIENFRNAERLARKEALIVHDFVDQMNQEIIQGLRHSARVSLSNVRNNFGIFTKKVGDKNLAFVSDIKEILSHLTELGLALDSMSSLRADVSESREYFDISDRFNKACSILKARIADEKISVRNQCPSMYIFGDGVAIQNAFLLLVLNSVQAFSDSNRPREQKITLIGRRSGNAAVVELSDNAGGIRIGRGEIQSLEDIWVTGKSSRRDRGGTGYGLPAVREIIQGKLHGGSIRLVNWVDGVTFRIEFPNALDPEAAREANRRRR